MVALILLVSMEVIHEPPLIRLFSGLGFFWVAILVGHDADRLSGALIGAKAVVGTAEALLNVAAPPHGPAVIRCANCSA